MSKKSFEEIEHIIKAAAEAHEPAFNEQAWENMEALLDKEKDRKRPFIFWLWWLLPLVLGTAAIGYFAFNNNAENKDQKETVVQPLGIKSSENKTNIGINEDLENNVGNNVTSNSPQNVIKSKPENAANKLSGLRKKQTVKPQFINPNTKSNDEELTAKRNVNEKVNGKMRANIKAVSPEYDDENNATITAVNNNKIVETSKSTVAVKTEDVKVITVDEKITGEKEMEKIVDSVIKKLRTDKTKSNKISRLYIITTGGAEANGVKLFSADKITARFGMGLGYQISKHLSVQTGFYVSNKKYTARGSDYKTKPGTYWNIVNINSIEADCKVYEIPISVLYNFTPDKKLNIFASAGLSSYIMKKENYYFYYDRYGTAHQAEVYYKGNKNLFSVLRLTAGVDKKISKQFSIIISPGIAIPLAGVGEGEVKLFSTDINFGLKFSPKFKK